MIACHNVLRNTACGTSRYCDPSSPSSEASDPALSPPFRRSSSETGFVEIRRQTTNGGGSNDFGVISILTQLCFPYLKLHDPLEFSIDTKAELNSAAALRACVTTGTS